MERQHARQVLDSLVRGVDPATGELLTRSNPPALVELVPALQVALAALDESIQRAERRARLPGNLGLPWKAEEERALLEAHRAGEPLEAIAERHGRTPAGIESRLEKLGQLAPEQRRTRSRFPVRRSGPDGSGPAR
jgi:hypothetical protein